MHVADRLEAQVALLAMPVLILRAERDRLTTDAWMNELSQAAPVRRAVQGPRRTSLRVVHPQAWSAPLRRLAISDQAAARVAALRSFRDMPHQGAASTSPQSLALIPGTIPTWVAAA